MAHEIPPTASGAGWRQGSTEGRSPFDGGLGGVPQIPFSWGWGGGNGSLLVKAIRTHCTTAAKSAGEITAVALIGVVIIAFSHAAN